MDKLTIMYVQYFWLGSKYNLNSGFVIWSRDQAHVNEFFALMNLRHPVFWLFQIRLVLMQLMDIGMTQNV